MRSSFVRVRLFAILAMAVGLMAGTSLAASAAPSAPAGGHVASYQSGTDICDAMIEADLIGWDYTVDKVTYPTLNSFIAAIGAFGLDPGSAAAIYNGACAAILGPPTEVPVPSIPPTEVPVPTETTVPTDVPSTTSTSSITINGYLSDQVAYPQFLDSDPFSTADAGGTIPADFTFELYVNGDTSAAPFAVVSTDGGAAFVDDVPTGNVTIYETSSGASADVAVISDEITAVTFFMPLGTESDVVPTEAPVEATAPADPAQTTAVPDGDQGKTDGGKSSTSVNSLPNTGQGSASSSDGSTIVLLFGAMSLVALAAGSAWRQRQTV